MSIADLLDKHWEGLAIAVLLLIVFWPSRWIR